MKTLILPLTLLLASTAHATQWRPSSSPARLIQSWNIPGLEAHLANLPLEGVLSSEKTPWPSSYFPSQRNSFNYRPSLFQAKSETFADSNFQKFFDLKRPTSLQEFASMTDIEVNQLSAFEKYSIYIGDFSYALDAQFEGANPKSAYWEGYCDAWSLAALQFEEPSEAEVTVGTKTIKFTSDDLKALLTASTQLQMKKPSYSDNTVNIGSRCDKEIAVPALTKTDGVEHYRDTTDTKGLLDKDLKAYLQQFQTDHARLGLEPISDAWIEKRLKNSRAPSCSGVNAGAFHLIITNQIGIHKKGFVFDVARDVEIWNQPAYRYASVITPVNGVPANATEGTARVVNVRTRLYYADDTLLGWAFSDPVLPTLLHGGLPSPRLADEYNRYENLLVKNGERESAGKFPEDLLESVEYQYSLELNAAGEVIGGNWITYDRPDYIWISNDPGLNENFSKLSTLIHKNT